MIVGTYPPKKVANSHISSVAIPPKKMVMGNPPAISGVSPDDIKNATKMGIDVAVYKARDAIVQRNYNNCPFKVGQVVMPRTKEDAETYGECRILHIAKNYVEYNEKDWPDGHTPRIILWECEKPTDDTKNKQFTATINYFEKPCGC